MTDYVRYVGPAHRRVITVSDWRAVGVDAPLSIWHSQNGFAIPAELFTESQIQKAFKNDPNFVVTSEDEEFKPKPGPYDMTPRELDNYHENPIDVVSFLEGHAVPNGGTSDDSRAEVLSDDDDRLVPLETYTARDRVV
jgi:hypothetical protein